MNVTQLIKKLEKLDGDSRVVVSGYEGGFQDILKIKGAYLYLNVNSEESYCGPHDTEKPDGSAHKKVHCYLL